MNCCKPEQVGTKRVRQYVETYPDPRRRQGSCQGGKNRETEGQTRRITGKECKILLNFHGTKGSMVSRKRENVLPKEEGDVVRE